MKTMEDIMEFWNESRLGHISYLLDRYRDEYEYEPMEDYRASAESIPGVRLICLCLTDITVDWEGVSIRLFDKDGERFVQIKAVSA